MEGGGTHIDFLLWSSHPPSVLCVSLTRLWRVFVCKADASSKVGRGSGNGSSPSRKELKTEGFQMSRSNIFECSHPPSVLCVFLFSLKYKIKNKKSSHLQNSKLSTYVFRKSIFFFHQCNNEKVRRIIVYFTLRNCGSTLKLGK